MMDTKDLQKLIEQAYSDAQEFLGEMAENVDPFDMSLASLKDQLFDWRNRGPDYWPKIVSTAITQAATAGKTLGDAMIAVLDHDRRMQELSAKGIPE